MVANLANLRHEYAILCLNYSNFVRNTVRQAAKPYDLQGRLFDFQTCARPMIIILGAANAIDLGK